MILLAIGNIGEDEMSKKLNQTVKVNTEQWKYFATMCPNGPRS